MNIKFDSIPLLIPAMPPLEDLLPYFEKIHESHIFSNFGPMVREIECKFSLGFGVDSACVCTVANATLGLELAIKALKLPPNSKILIPALTFVATATAVVSAGHIPVISDVDIESWVLTPNIAIEACKNSDIAAVIPVATFGFPHDLHEWDLFCDQQNVPVIIDAAAAYGSQWLPEKISQRIILVFSLHATKALPAAEGGLIVSKNKELVATIRELCNFGINLRGGDLIPVGALGSIGSNAKMSEYHAAIGLASLNNWAASSNKRRELFIKSKDFYLEKTNNRIKFQRASEELVKAPTTLTIALESNEQRNFLEKICLDRGVSTRRWYQPLIHRMDVFQKSIEILDTKNIDIISDKLIGLPFFVNMTDEQLNRVGECLEAVFI